MAERRGRRRGRKARPTLPVSEVHRRKDDEVNEVRARLRALLTREEQALDNWLYDLCNSIDEDDAERNEIESMGFGLLFRCMAIGAKHPDWTFFAVLAEGKRTAVGKVSVQDILKTRRH
jgi:hypothetical protein